MLKRLSFALAVLFCIFHCWTAMFGAAAGIGQKAIHLGLVLIIFFWTTWRRRTGSGTAG